MQVPTDIETCPQQPEDAVKAEIAETIEPPASMKKPETIAAWHAGDGKYAGEKEALIEKKYRDTSFDGAKGEIISIAWAIEDSDDHHCIERPFDVGSEKQLLQQFFDRVRQDVKQRPPQFAGHFLDFDLPFLFQRAVINQVNPGFDIGQWGRHPRDYFDTMVAWAGFRGHISLDNLCAALAISIPSPEGIEGATVWDAYKEGRHKDIKEYNISDIKKVQAIIKRLRFR